MDGLPWRVRFWGKGSQTGAGATPMAGAAPPRRWLVLELGRNPSTDYYIRPSAEEAGVPVSYRDIESDPPQASDLSDGTLVVIVRYLSRRWAGALRAALKPLAGVAYFMDDDLLDAAAWKGLPAPYRAKLQRYCAAHRADIAALASEYWVASAALQVKYAALAPRLFEPRWPREAAREAEPLTLFYYGTSVHRDELAWLRPIVGAALLRHPRLHFELVGEHETNKLYRDLPRVSVVHPMGWPNFAAFCASRRRHIGLVPLLPGPFNAARSHTKFFDIARCGAAGIFADVAPYRGFVRDGIDGLLAPDDSAAWAGAIDRLVGDVPLRESIAGSALERCLALTPQAE